MSAADQIRKLDADMYPAPWKRSSRQPFDDHDILAEDGAVVTEHAGEDAAPIALLRNALPLLADAIEAAEKHAVCSVYGNHFRYRCHTCDGCKTSSALAALAAALNQEERS